MSYEAEGTVSAIPLATPPSAVGVGVAAIGALGYLFFRGCQKSAKACHDAWRRHLERLEQERKERLERMRENDEKRVRQVQARIKSLAKKSADFVAELQKLRLTELRRQENELHETQAKINESIIQKRLEMVEEELQIVRQCQNDATQFPLLWNDDQKENYERELAKAITKLQSARRPATPNVRGPQSENSSAETEPTEDIHSETMSLLKKRLFDCVAALAVLSHLDETEYSEIYGLISIVGYEEQGAEERIKELENKIHQAREKDETRRKVRAEALALYQHLLERYLTVKNDEGLALCVPEALQRIEKQLLNAEERLRRLHDDHGALCGDLEREASQFEKAVQKALVNHQNNQAEKIFESVLTDLGYRQESVCKDDDEVQVTGIRGSGDDEARVRLTLGHDGRFQLELSPEGFESQAQCMEEMKRIQRKLAERGFWVNPKRVEPTWISHFVAAVKEELVRHGYAPQDLMEERDGEAVRVLVRKGSHQEELRIDPVQGISANPHPESNDPVIHSPRVTFKKKFKEKSREIKKVMD